MIKTALITGGAGGIGFELAKVYAKNNYNLVLVDINDKALQIAKNIIEQDFKIKAAILAIDLSTDKAAEKIYNYTAENYIVVNTLVNNAGFGVYGKYSQSDWDREQSMMNIHVYVTAALCKFYLKEMVVRNEGQILNVASLAGFQPGPLMSMYYATKAFVISFTESISREHKDTNLNISVLCPGITKTGFQKSVSENSVPKERNMDSAKYVAEYAFEKLTQKKVVIIPGFKNKLLSILPGFLPRSIARNVLYSAQSKNRDE